MKPLIYKGLQVITYIIAGMFDKVHCAKRRIIHKMTYLLHRTYKPIRKPICTTLSTHKCKNAESYVDGLLFAIYNRSAQVYLLENLIVSYGEFRGVRDIQNE